jgi:serine/threonine protein kinase/serine/threonine protein phosphatase PrpC
MTTQQLRIRLGQGTDKGRKPLNQDFHGLIAPQEPLLSTKGIAMALADGISSSDVSQIASATSVKGFLEDYYATPEAWSVKTSVDRVLQATNSWLYAQTRSGPNRYAMDRGYVCTFSALVFKSTTAHLFHIGDTRVYRLIDKHLEQLSEDHRLWLSKEKSHLSRALGMRDRLEIDYQTFPIEVGDTFVLGTDGVYEFVDERFVVETLMQQQDDLDQAARLILDEALERGSDDNLTLQILRIEQLPLHGLKELHEQLSMLPFPPELRPRLQFDGYEILRELHHSSRSHVYLAVDTDSQRQVCLKVPSVDLRDNAAYLDRFLMEERVARRVDNVHLLKPCEQTRKRNYLYIVSEFIEGQTLNQWMTDNPNPDLETVREIVEQIAKGLYALHRQKMLHQDLRPNNIILDKTRTVVLIDFGSVRVAGVAEITGTDQRQILGTAQYTAPEYFLGESGTTRSDLFSLGVITYQMLSGRLPYGTQVAKSSSRAAQRRLVYHSVLDNAHTLPAWVDETLRKAVQPNPHKRYEEISEFVHDLRQPNPIYLNKNRPPLLERNPILFWKSLSSILLRIINFLLGTHPIINR